jgi:hypothetical protein
MQLRWQLHVQPLRKTLAVLACRRKSNASIRARDGCHKTSRTFDWNLTKLHALHRIGPSHAAARCQTPRCTTAARVAPCGVQQETSRAKEGSTRSCRCCSC